MPLNRGIDTIMENIGVSFESTVLLILLFGSLMFFAKDFKLGTIMLFMMSGGVFMWFFNEGMNFAPVLIIFLISFVMMALSLYSVSRQATEGGVI